MTNILDYYARTHTAGLHARGRAGTALLLREMNLSGRPNVLEIGFGTGQMLVEVAARRPEAKLYGVEKSAVMMQTAHRRLRFCGLEKRIALSLLENERLPYPDVFFDWVYAESVLGILPDEAIAGMFREISRVLRPGGVFLNNESLWRPGVTAEARREINCRCRAAFGIPQAPEQYSFPDDWRHLAEQNGLPCEKIIALHDLATPSPPGFHPLLLRSAVFSGFGKIKGFFSPALRDSKRAIAAAERAFAPYGLFLEGTLFRFVKKSGLKWFEVAGPQHSNHFKPGGII